MSTFITEYKEVETFTDFVSRYYSYKEDYEELVKYKQSDEIITDLYNYLNEYINNAKIINSFTENEINIVDKEEINEMLHYKYDRLPLFERMDEIAKKDPY